MSGLDQKSMENLVIKLPRFSFGEGSYMGGWEIYFGDGSCMGGWEISFGDGSYMGGWEISVNNQQHQDVVKMNTHRIL